MNYLNLVQNAGVAYLVTAAICVQVYIAPSSIIGYILSLALVAVIPPAALIGSLFVFSMVMKSWAAAEYPEKELDPKMAELLTFKDKELEAEFKGKNMPMTIFYEAYMNKKVELNGDMYEILVKHRETLFRFCFTWYHVKYFCFRLIPQALWHTKSMDGDEVKAVYNRGNDFYNWFLGPSMVYTSGIYTKETDSLEDAQARKMDGICQKLQLKPGQTMLDIGCGWGSLVRHASKYYGAKTFGVTICKEQIAWGRDGIKKDGTEDLCNVELMDYRDIPLKKWDAISCVEMAEHVGVLRFQNFLHLVSDRLEDDGLFYLQIAGLRAPWRFEDFVWGIFMGTYIFPAADASCPLGFVVNQVEAAGFEVHHIQNVGVHYSITLKQWYDNWLKNEKEVVAKYGEWWFRLWVVFLSWSSIIAGQGSSTCWQIILHKNKNATNRKRYIGKVQYGVPEPSKAVQ